MTDRRGPFGIEPLHFSVTLFGLLLLFVLYLLLPRAMRKQYFGAYPKRHAWSARTKARRNPVGSAATAGSRSYAPSSVEGSYTAGSSSLGTNTNYTHPSARHMGLQPGQQQPPPQQQQPPPPQGAASASQADGGLQDEIVVSAAMQQLREPGVLIVAHGSRGKPKTVRLQLTEAAITWRTETRKKGAKDWRPKMGKLHQVPLSHIMYVDVGKQTTALRRVENAAVSETLCFSLLTKEGSLDLEANSSRERDALVACFSLVLDEVHAQNWRDIYRGPSSDMPSSFDEDGRNDDAASKV